MSGNRKTGGGGQFSRLYGGNFVNTSHVGHVTPVLVDYHGVFLSFSSGGICKFNTFLYKE